MAHIVFTNGCFDILHVGHFNTLNYCREIADRKPAGTELWLSGSVIVALDSDNKIKKDKGKDRPYFSFEERKHQMLSLTVGGRRLVDNVYSFDTNEELYDLIKAINPDYILKSEQWKDSVVGSDISTVVYVPVLSEFSTTKISQKIIEKYFHSMESELANPVNCELDGLDEK